MKLTILIISLVFLSSCAYTDCKKEGGKYDFSHKECINISENSCKNIGGTYESCGSSCRHDPNTQMCTADCAVYCKL